MSTRYVWEKSTATISVSFPTISGNSNALSAPVSENPEIYLCEGYTKSFFEGTAEVKFSPSGNYVKLSASDVGKSYSTSTYQYAIVTRPAIKTSSIMRYVSSGLYWLFSKVTSSGIEEYRVRNCKDISGTRVSSGCYGVPSVNKTSVGKASSSSSSEYPESGELNGFFYDYLGSDSIDPVSISYATLVEYQGAGNLTKLQYTITPSRSNLYGGDIEYSVEYNQDNSGWNGGGDWFSGTTGSRINFALGSSYQFRVRARDRWGFTSSTYATGPVCKVVSKKVITLSVSPENGGAVSGGGEYSVNTSATVTATPANGWEFVGWTENGTTVSTSSSYTFTVTANRSLIAVFKQKLTAWIGVNGKARKGVELYVGVNGKARKVTAAYIGVNGKARRFL